MGLKEFLTLQKPKDKKLHVVCAAKTLVKLSLIYVLEHNIIWNKATDVGSFMSYVHISIYSLGHS